MVKYSVVQPLMNVGAGLGPKVGHENRAVGDQNQVLLSGTSLAQLRNSLPCCSFTK